MNHRIWKYYIDKGQDITTTITVTPTHKVVAVGVQDEEIVVWVEVREGQAIVHDQKFRVVWTGVNFNCFDVYIGTVIIDGLVYHVLETHNETL